MTLNNQTGHRRSLLPSAAVMYLGLSASGKCVPLKESCELFKLQYKILTFHVIDTQSQLMKSKNH